MKPPTESTRGPWAWPVGVVLAVLVAAVVPLLFDPNYYYVADTAEGAYGGWYHLGWEIRAGRWPLISPDRWMAGNYAAEGQWGLVSPVTIAISLAATVATNPVLLSSAVKVAFLLLGGLGTYALARSYAVSRPFSWVAGVTAPLGGFTLYMDAPSWVTNLMVWAFFPWCWWALRRMSGGGGSGWFFVFGYLTVAVGYVHGVILLAALIAAHIVEELVARRFASAGRCLVAGLAVGFVAVAVFLPGILTQAVTIRSDEAITNNGFLVADLSGLAMGVLPTALPQLSAWWGFFAPGPVLYIAWFLPVLAVVDVSRARSAVRRLLVPFLVLGTCLLFILGPSYVGPLRFPTRLMSYLVLTVVLVTVVLLDRSRVSHPSRARLVMGAALVLAATYLAWSSTPQQWKVQWFTGLVVVALVVTTMMLLRSPRSPSGGKPTQRAALFIGVASIFLVGLQHSFFDGTQTSSPHRYPSSVSGYQSQLRSGVNDALVVGAPAAVDPKTGILGETLVASTWYLNPNVDVQNVYTTISFRAYAEQNCMDHLGSTCPELLARLWTVDATTGLPLVDLLAVDTVQILKSAVPSASSHPVPPGWSKVEDGSFTVTWRRDRPLGPAGGPVWSSPGTRVSVLQHAPDHVRLRVDETSTDAKVVLSRLAWPGYSVEGADITMPLNGYLLTVDVSKAPVGSTVDLLFRPAGFPASVAAYALGLALAAGLFLAETVGLRRSRRVSAGLVKGSPLPAIRST